MGSGVDDRPPAGPSLRPAARFSAQSHSGAADIRSMVSS